MTCRGGEIALYEEGWCSIASTLVHFPFSFYVLFFLFLLSI